MLVGCDHALTTAGMTDHGWSGCSTTSPGQSNDRKKLPHLIFLVLPLIDVFFDSSCST
jgi:hypothetical protein